MSSDFCDLEHNMDDFNVRAIIAVEFQIMLRNFKVSKKIDVIKVYLFRLFGVYLGNDLIHSMMSTSNKHQQGEKK